MEDGSHAMVLLVEDDPVIALDTSMVLKQLGAAHVEMALSLDEAVSAINGRTPILALMDIDLRGATSFALAERLRDQGVPCVFTTGHSIGLEVPSGLEDATIIQKPYDLIELKEVLEPYLARAMDGRCE